MGVSSRKFPRLLGFLRICSLALSDLISLAVRFCVLEKFAEIAYNLEKDETTRRASPF